MQRLPTVVKNLLIINVLMFLASQLFGDGFYYLMAGFHFQSAHFEIWQVVTHMFMHGSLTHLFFNMFALYMFGGALESTWGPKRFLTYYMLTGIGAYFLHFLVITIEMQSVMQLMAPESIQDVLQNGAFILESGKNYTAPLMSKLNFLVNTGVVGASGAVFGILLAFGMLFPNTRLMLLFPPIPIKAKIFVLGYGAIELMLALQNNPGDSVAHFAHLGGMLFGYIILKYWQKKRTNFY